MHLKKEERIFSPLRSSRKGTIPGVTGLVENEDDKWINSNLELRKWEEKLVVASVVQVAIIVMMSTHLYTVQLQWEDLPTNIWGPNRTEGDMCLCKSGDELLGHCLYD